MNRAVLLPIAILGGAVLGYGLLRILLDGLALAGLSMVSGPPLPASADGPFALALIGAGLACWALCGWLIWRGLRRR